MTHKWFIRLLIALVWALAAGSAVYWGLRTSQTGLSQPAPSPSESASLPAVEAGALARLLGHKAAQAEQAEVTGDRWALLGVIAQGRQGVALLSLDGKPPRPYQVGSDLEEGLMLKAVGPRHVELGQRDAATVQRLVMPALVEQDAPTGLILGASAKP